MRLIGTIQPVQPYNFAVILEVLSHHIVPVLDYTFDAGYWRVIRQGDELGLLRVVAVGDVLEVYQAASNGRVDETRLLDSIRFVLGVDDDLSSFYAMAQRDRLLWQVIEGLVGFRWLRSESVFEALMLTIIEQQIAWKTAQKAQRWLVEWGGERVSYQGETFFAFPKAEQIAHVRVDDLKPLKITYRRMQVMIDVAQQVVSGELDLDGFSVDELYKALVKIKGIGHWTATWTIQRVKGQQPFVGHNDVALQAAVNHYFLGGKGRIPAQQVAEIFSRYGDYAGIAANHTLIRWALDRY